MLWKILFFAVLAVPAQAADCVRYGATVTLTGTYSLGVLSPTDAGADPLILPGRTSDLLILDTPLCIDADPVSNGVAAAADVQLLCPGLTVDDGATTSLTGRLVGAHTGNGHTPVLLVCRL